MLKRTFWLISVALTLAPMSQAKALCIYHGKLDAETTVAEEFADSRWVVRARVTARTDSWTRSSPHDDGPLWTIYRIEIVEAFKGSPPRIMTVFTTRDSGGFYLEPRSGGPDPYAEHLLFLNPTRPHDDDPPEARGTATVNYNCGRSKPWNELTTEDIEALSVARSGAMLR